MIYTTLNKIREHSPCTEGWQKLLSTLGKTKADDEPLSLITILDSNGLDDALWCLRAVDGHKKEIRLYAVWCARQVPHLMTDPCDICVLDVAERHAHGQATDSDLAAARRQARHSSARNTARDEEWDAAFNVAGNAVWDIVWNAEGDEQYAAFNAARDAQKVEFRRVFGGVSAIGESIND